ncbi:MAG: hypothetical protein ACLQJR_34605 [Stellaceae bacterium]
MNQNDAIEFLKAYANGDQRRPTLAHATTDAILNRGGHLVTRRNRKLGRSQLYNKAHDVSQEDRDNLGRWTASGSSIEHAAADAARSTGSSDGRVRTAFRAAVTGAHAAAAKLADQLRHVVGSTKFAGASPLPNGGIELRTSHVTRQVSANGARPARITTYAQIHPSHVASSPTASRVLAAAHAALSSSGARSAPVRHPPIAATFSS